LKINSLRIWPPLAIARLGSADEPMDNYALADPDPSEPLGYRKIEPKRTLRVTAEGRIKSFTPPEIHFKKDGKIRPVAPFLEVHAVAEGGESRLLTDEDVKRVSWKVSVANRKVFRRTGDKDDIVEARAEFHDYEPHALDGRCRNFVDGKTISFGHVRFIRPDGEFREIRLRFTPAKGLIYGPQPLEKERRLDFQIPSERQVYDRSKGHWQRFGDDTQDDGSETHSGHGSSGNKKTESFHNETLPPSLFAIYPPAPPWLYDNRAVSRGFLDDACDGFVEVAVHLSDGRTMNASARIVVAPPALAPDSLFVRSLSDDLEQVVKGPAVEGDDLLGARDKALDIVRRAFETVRFMNVAVMNGNDFKGRQALKLDSMPEEEAADTERAIRPIMAPGTVDTFAIMTLHQQAYAAIRAGAAPWFVRLLRKPDEVADFTDRGRRKMPALMCGADNNYLALTWRQIDTIRKSPDAASSPRLTPRNRTAKLAEDRMAQLNYAAAGNPVNSRPESSVANCCPGLEMDFRAVWRRMFKGIVLREYDNLVVDTDSADKTIASLKGRRLLSVHLPGDRKEPARTIPMVTEIRGPASSDPDGYVIETTEANPRGVAPLEWSNALSSILRRQGETLRCDFSKEESWEIPRALDEEFVSVALEVRHFFEADTAVISRALAEAGELTQGLCSPWQNDYRECSCYYWASARPDYVNVELGEDGLSKGDNWMQKSRTGSYVPDDYADTRLFLYDELFEHWEKLLRFQVEGRDWEDPHESKAAGCKE